MQVTLYKEINMFLIFILFTCIFFGVDGVGCSSSSSEPELYHRKVKISGINQNQEKTPNPFNFNKR